MVKNLGRVTKTWTLKKGGSSDYTEYPNLDVQAMVKEGGIFVPVSDANSAAESGSSGTGGSSSNSPAPELQADETVADPGRPDDERLQAQNYADMSVEQLKAYLSAKGVASSELRGRVKADLVACAETVAESEKA
jgi:hypothetical protein